MRVWKFLPWFDKRSATCPEDPPSLPKHFSIVTIFSFQTGAAGESSFTDFSFMVHCKHSGIDRVYYLATIAPDGVDTYMSLDRQAGTEAFRGPAKSVGGDGSGTCAGKTIQQLRKPARHSICIRSCGRISLGS